MEDKYSLSTPKNRKDVIGIDGNKKSITFFRGNKSVNDVFIGANKFNGKVKDANKEINYQVDLLDLIDEVESCDIFSNCSDI